MLATTPVQLESLTLTPSTVFGRYASTATARLTWAAPTGGAAVTLSSSNSTVAAVPASVTVAAGQTSANATVTTTRVGSDTPVTISGTYGRTQSASLMVQTCTTATVTPPTPPANEVVWFDDQLPAGNAPGGTWLWDTTQHVTGVQSHTNTPQTGASEHWFVYASNTLAVGAGDTLFTYVMINPCEVPDEIELGFYDAGNVWHWAYWGQHLSAPGGTEVRIGDIPTAGEWVRLDVIADQVGVARTSVGVKNSCHSVLSANTAGRKC